MISQKEAQSCNVYIDLFSKFLKTCLNYYIEQVDLIIIPLDFLVIHNNRMGLEKVFKLCQKFILLIKQVLYEVSLQ